MCLALSINIIIVDNITVMTKSLSYMSWFTSAKSRNIWLSTNNLYKQFTTNSIVGSALPLYTTMFVS